jgi:hypothetical protein
MGLGYQTQIIIVTRYLTQANKDLVGIFVADGCYHCLRQISLCSLSWPGTCYVNQAGLKLPENFLPQHPKSGIKDVCYYPVSVFGGGGGGSGGGGGGGGSGWLVWFGLVGILVLFHFVLFCFVCDKVSLYNLG